MPDFLSVKYFEGRTACFVSILKFFLFPSLNWFIFPRDWIEKKLLQFFSSNKGKNQLIPQILERDILSSKFENFRSKMTESIKILFIKMTSIIFQRGSRENIELKSYFSNLIEGTFFGWRKWMNLVLLKRKIIYGEKCVGIKLFIPVEIDILEK